MLFIDGSFHGDPHAGNLLIRPVPLKKRYKSRSKHNFEVVLLGKCFRSTLPERLHEVRMLKCTYCVDHGLWFDVSRSLRTNYARLWLSLLTPKTPEVDAERRKYAALVGNIGDDLFPIFEAAITGRAPGAEQGASSLDEPTPEKKDENMLATGSLLDLAVQTPEEAQALRNAFMEEGIIEGVFELLRRVPRRLLMVLKIK